MAHPESQFSGWLRKVLAGLECYHTTPLDFDFFTGLRVAAHPGFPINVPKSPESNQGDLAVPFL